MTEEDIPYFVPGFSNKLVYEFLNKNQVTCEQFMVSFINPIETMGIQGSQSQQNQMLLDLLNRSTRLADQVKDHSADIKERVKEYSAQITDKIKEQTTHIRDQTTHIRDQTTHIGDKIESIIAQMKVALTETRDKYVSELQAQFHTNGSQARVMLTELMEKQTRSLPDVLEQQQQQHFAKLTETIQATVENNLAKNMAALQQMGETNKQEVVSSLQTMVNTTNEQHPQHMAQITESIRAAIEHNLVQTKDALQQVEDANKRELMAYLKDMVPTPDNHVSIKEHLETFVTKIETQSQCTLRGVTTQNEQLMKRVEDKLVEMDRQLAVHTSTQTAKLHAIEKRIDDFITPYQHNSSIKGAASETRLYNKLMDMFPSSEVRDNTGVPHAGDFWLLRPDKSPVLIENKSHERKVLSDTSSTSSAAIHANTNLDKKEVQKFIDDCTRHKMHGVLLCQNNGIVGKKQFHVDCVQNRALVYVHKHNFSEDKLLAALAIIDAFDHILSEYKGHHELDNSIGLPQENIVSDQVLAEFNNEIIQFITKRDSIVTRTKGRCLVCFVCLFVSVFFFLAYVML